MLVLLHQQLEARVALGVVVMVKSVVALLALLALQTPVAVAVEIQMLELAGMLAALVLLFFQYQQLNIQAQPQAHQQSRQAAQIQF